MFPENLFRGPVVNSYHIRSVRRGLSPPNPTLVTMSTTEVRREVTHANGVPPPDSDLPVRDYSGSAVLVVY